MKSGTGICSCCIFKHHNKTARRGLSPPRELKIEWANLWWGGEVVVKVSGGTTPWTPPPSHCQLSAWLRGRHQDFSCDWNAAQRIVIGNRQSRAHQSCVAVKSPLTSTTDRRKRTDRRTSSRSVRRTRGNPVRGGGLLWRICDAAAS